MAGTLFLCCLCAWLCAPYFADDPMAPLAGHTPLRKYYDAEGNLVKLESTFDYEWREDVELEKVSQHFISAILSVEDAGFHEHGGVSYKAICRAAWGNLCNGRITSGASTLTMQLVALPEAGKRKNMLMKLTQAVKARKLEGMLSKREILKEYVNRIPFGGKIYGIEAASRYYFSKSASELKVEEAALLAGIPQRPNALRPDRYPERARKRQRLVLDSMERNGFIQPGQAKKIHEAELHYGDFTMPSYYARFRHGKYDMYMSLACAESEGAYEVKTALHQDFHDMILSVLKGDCATMPDVNDAAAVLLDSRSSKVLALIGTLDFFSSRSGQVNGAIRSRSAGSTLKPFIYAEAIDGGLICGATVLNDSPLRFGSYAPGNYDGTFCGNVRAEVALSKSLNTPVIRLLAELGVDRVLKRLDSIGLLHKSREFLEADKGLTIALGTAGHSLLDLTNAYSCLANDGVYTRRSFLKSSQGKGKRIFTSGTAFMLGQMLRLNQLPECQHEVAWKTGTSNGLCDAWCFIYTPDYTLGVWFGNKNGRSSSFLVGAKSALPTAAKIISGLYKSGSQPDWGEPADFLSRTELCEKSGLIPSLNCKKTSLGWTLKGFQMRKCSSCANSSNKKILILSPKSATYMAKDSMGVDLLLSANSKSIVWFVDGIYVGEIPDDKPFTFAPGRHVVNAVALDEGTDGAQVTFWVKEE